MKTEIIELDKEIRQTINTINNSIIKGKYVENGNELSYDIYNSFIHCQIASLCLSENIKEIDVEFLSSLDKNAISAKQNFETSIYAVYNEILEKNDEDRLVYRDSILRDIFAERGQEFIKEICGQNVIYGRDVAAQVSKLLLDMAGYIYTYNLGFEKMISFLTSNYSFHHTEVYKKFSSLCYRNKAILRDRVYNFKLQGSKFKNKIDITENEENSLDYRTDKNYCELAIIHIGVAETGGTGTGFVISPDGYAITCAHVLKGSSGELYPVAIYDSGYEVAYAEVKYVNEKLDIAVIKLDGKNWNYLPLENRVILPELGEEVVVFGFPLGYQLPESNKWSPNVSLYKGYVSSNQIEGGCSIVYLDINVKQGNSGSPVISTKTGKVIGILSGAQIGGTWELREKMPYMIPIQHFLKLNE